MTEAVAIIVPTYREVESLPILVPRVAAALAESGRPFEIVVVDDDSRDGTEEACRELASSHPLRLIVRRGQRDLSSAVLEGFRCTEAQLLVVIDADLSHPPEKIPDLVGALEAGADFAMGSRYVPGGETDESWGPLRRLNSRVATLFARPLVAVSDPLAGFFAIRRETLDAGAELDPLGFKIGLELMVKCRCLKIEEVSIRFSRRYHGESKMGLREQWNYVRHLCRLYLFRFRDRHLSRAPR